MMGGGGHAACWIILLFQLVGFSSSETTIVEVPRSFVIDYENDQFLLNGEPFRYVSGSFHYFRAPRAYWRDRLRKMRAAGLNAVSTYVEWSQHEPSPGIFNFNGELDLLHFIQLAQEEDLLVLLRPGPYICAERDMGGLPSWLLSEKPDIELRSSDETFLYYADRYLNRVLTLVRHQLFGNGGPIVLVQIENEYGSYPACDYNYTSHLRDVVKNLVGDAAVLYTTDGGATSFLRCGKIPEVYASVDFGSGSDVQAAFGAQRLFQPKGPYINSEYYPGWLTHWGEPLQTVSTQPILDTLEKMLRYNASVNFYMFFGGTNFGFMAGANYGDTYQPQITSYDYDAPISEAGDLTSKYFAIKEVVGKYLVLPNITVPASSPKTAYGVIPLERKSSLLNVSQNVTPLRNEYPLSFEQIGQRYGFMLYETTLGLSVPDPSVLKIPDVRDRAIVMVNGVTKGILSRSEKNFELPLTVQRGDTINILVENQGRINYGPKNNDFKGIINNVTLGTHVLKDWKMYGLPLSTPPDTLQREIDSSISAPAFYQGSFVIDSETVNDTFLDTTGWGKGVAYVNDFNLGRYWPIMGPQVTLYVPAVYLKKSPEVNVLTLLELESANSPLVVSFVSDPILNKQPPTVHTRRSHSGHVLHSVNQNEGPFTVQS